MPTPVWNAAAKSASMVAKLAQIDSNANPATLEIGTAGMATVLVTLPLSKPSFSQSGGVLTMLGAPKSATASLSGTAAAARIKDGAGAVVVSGLTVGISASDIVLSAVAFATGATVNLTAATITHG